MTLKTMTPIEEVLAIVRDPSAQMVVTGGLTVIATLALPDIAGRAAGQFLWLAVLSPMFVLAHRQGRSGAHRGLTFAVAVLIATSLLGLLTGASWARWPHVIGVAVGYVMVASGTGWLAERLRTEVRDAEGMALHDPLTGLPNHMHAKIFLQAAVAAVDRDVPVTVVVWGLDQFERFNDAFGRQGTDKVLEIFSEVLTASTRRSNLSARVGGEEFITILTDCNLHGGMIFAERLRQAVKVRAGDIGLTVSAGVSTLQSGAGDLDDLLAGADEALSQAKAAGSDCVRASSSLIWPMGRVYAA